MATLDIVDDDDDHLEFVPLVDHGIGREDIVEAEQKIAERSKYGRHETDPVLIQENQRHHEMLEELIGKVVIFYPTGELQTPTRIIDSFVGSFLHYFIRGILFAVCECPDFGKYVTFCEGGARKVMIRHVSIYSAC